MPLGCDTWLALGRAWIGNRDRERATLLDRAHSRFGSRPAAGLPISSAPQQLPQTLGRYAKRKFACRQARIADRMTNIPLGA